MPTRERSCRMALGQGEKNQRCRGQGRGEGWGKLMLHKVLQASLWVDGLRLSHKECSPGDGGGGRVATLLKHARAVGCRKGWRGWVQ